MRERGVDPYQRAPSRKQVRHNAYAELTVSPILG
jgi:hypothetical protein